MLAIGPERAGLTTFIALLRAVNVGGTGKMPMAALRELAKEAGFGEVRSYIQSGNLVFASPETPEMVQSVLEQQLERYAGRPVGVVLRMAQDMRAVLAANPFPEAEPSKVGVLFLDDAPPPDTVAAAKGRADEEIAVARREVYVYYPSGMGRTKLRLGCMTQGTMRNINTVAKLVDMTTDA